MISIREATENDLDGIFNIENSSFTVPWSREMIEDTFYNNYTKVFAADDGEELVGYASVGLMTPDAELLSIAVDPKRRREGIGEMLFDSILAYLDKKDVSDLFLEVRESNEAAIELYLKKGFEVIGRRKQYYQRPVEDAVLMHYKNESGEILC